MVAAKKKGKSSTRSVEFTIFENIGKPLSKEISLAADGSVQSKPAGKMSKGKAWRAKVSDVEQFANTIGTLTSNQAIALGSLRKDLSKTVKVTTKRKLNGAVGVIARDQDHIVYHKNKPALVLIDYDQKGKPTYIQVGDFWETLCVVFPALREAAHVLRRSTSAGLYNGDVALPASGGWHVFVVAEDGTDIERFLNTLHDRCWLAGFGWFYVSKVGSLLERSIIDKSVSASERLVFEGPPIVKPPLRQDAEMRHPSFCHGEVIDTLAVCPDLTAEEQKQVDQLKSAGRERMQPEADRVKAAYIEKCSQELVERCGITIEEARKKITAQCERSVLYPEFVLEFDNPNLRGCTVGDVLTNPYMFNEEALADPEEGVEYGSTTAKVYVRGNGVPWINSFAHGGKAYTLSWEPEDDTPPEDTEEAEEKPEAETTAKQPGAGAAKQPGPAKKPLQCAIIKIHGGELPMLATRAEKELLRHDMEIYQRGNVLVRPIIEEVDAAHERKTKIARFVEIGSVYLCDLLGRIIAWEKFDKRSMQWRPVDTPPKLADTLLARDGEWKFPKVAGVIATPTLRPDGTIIDQEGYDAVTHLLLLAPPPMPPIPDQPTKDDAIRALALLEELLVEFPFVGDVDRSVALSGFITPVVRGAFTVAPMHAANAPVAGSGKSYLFDCVAAIAIGRLMPVMAAGREEAETEKRLGAAIMTGQALIDIDNVNGELQGDALCQMIERPIVDVRVLGESRQMRVEARGTTMFCTGNNITIVGDLCRRTILLNLDPEVERPELREFNDNPVEKILANRGAYIAACLTICRAYIVAGHPDQAKPLASFEGWSNIVRSALLWLGKADPVTSMEYTRANDPKIEQLRGMCWSLGATPSALATNTAPRCRRSSR